MVLYEESISLLNGGSAPTDCRETLNLRAILEDVNSPVTQKLHAKLYQAVIDKKHIDFGDIAKSEGNIKQYSGYPSMMDTLNTLMQLAQEQKSKDVVKYATIVTTAIHNIENLSSTYARGFQMKSDYVMLEYNTYVYMCVEATTALIYDFTDYIKNVTSMKMEISIRNTNQRADLFFFQQLKAFNDVNASMGMDYRKYLDTCSNRGKDGFTGNIDEIIGIGAIVTVALSIVPITRKAISFVYKVRGDISKELQIQANFLEMNKSCVEANPGLTVDQKKKILSKQEKLKRNLESLSAKIKVKNVRAEKESATSMKSEDKMFSVDNLKDEVSSSDFQIM